MTKEVLSDRLAFVVSALFSPFITSTVFGLLSIAVISHNDPERFLKIALFIALIVGVPFISILLGRRQGKITDWHIMEREQRMGPFIAATFGAFVLFLAFRFLHVSRSLQAMSLALLVSGLVFSFITNYWKISIHAAAYAGGVLILSLVSSRPGLLLLELGLPLIIWARLKRKRHSIWQGLGAVLVVCLCIWAVFRFY